jgi:hypothetical protein
LGECYAEFQFLLLPLLGQGRLTAEHASETTPATEGVDADPVTITTSMARLKRSRWNCTILPEQKWWTAPIWRLPRTAALVTTV